MTDESKPDQFDEWVQKTVTWLSTAGAAMLRPHLAPEAQDQGVTEPCDDAAGAPEEREERLRAEAAFWNTDLRNYPPGSYRTKSGRVLRPEDIERLVEEAEAGYDLDAEPAPAVNTVVTKLLDPSGTSQWHGWSVVEVKMMPGSFTHLRVGVRHTSGRTVFYHFTYEPHGVR